MSKAGESSPLRRTHLWKWRDHCKGAVRTSSGSHWRWNLNTHTKGTFYRTPMHGTWLNVAERELSAVTRHWLRGHRLGGSHELRA